MRKRSKQGLKMILPLLALFVANRLFSQTAPLNIKEAIDIALTNNRSLKADSLNISITNDKNKQLAAGYKPQVNYSSGTEYNPAIPTQMLPGKIAGQADKDFVPVQFGTKYNMKSGVEVTQTLYKQDLLIQMRASGLQTSIAKTKYELSKEELVYQIASLFYSLQANAELIRTTQADYVNMRDVQKIAKAQYENNLLKRIDYESIQINVANTLSYLNQLKTQYSEQLVYFNYLLGLPVKTETAISSSIPQDLAPVETGNYLSLREDILLSSQLIEAKEVELHSIRAERKPSVSTYFRYNYQSQFDSPSKAFDGDYLSNASTFGVSVSFPIFDGNRRKSRINIAKTELDQLKLKSDRQKEEAEMELFSAKSTLDNKEQDYLITKNNLELASKVFNSRKALYTEGVTTLVELLDADRELSQARNQHMQSIINVQSGRLDVHKANGTLLTEFIK